MIRTAAVLCLLLPCAWALRSAPSPTAQAAAQADAGFEALQGAYASAMVTYDQQRVAAGRGEAPPPSVHPARTFWPRFEALARGGSALAKGWLCENVRDAVDVPPERARVLRTWLEDLLACCADHEALSAAVTGLNLVAEDLGLDAAADLAERIGAVSTVPEIRGRAILLQASLVTHKGRADDPERAAAADELRRSVVYAFAGTKVAKEAAALLHPAVQRQLRDAQRAWVDRARALQAAGRTAADWPPQPIHDAYLALLPLAGAGHVEAKGWCEKFHPAFLQAERQGPAFAAAWLTGEYGQVFSPYDSDWTSIRLDLFELALRESPAAPWVRTTLRDLMSQIPSIDPLRPLPLMATVLELSGDAEARVTALWCSAETRRLEGSEQQWAQALAEYGRIEREFPEWTRFVADAQLRRAALHAVMPGQPLPQTRHVEPPLRDSEQLDLNLEGYRGRVLMIDLFRLPSREYDERAESRRTLLAAMEGQPFVLVGLCTNAVAPHVWNTESKRLGITWRTGLLHSNHPYAAALQPRRSGTTILVDAEGVIRARDRDWDEMVRLARELCAQTAAAAK